MLAGGLNGYVLTPNTLGRVGLEVRRPKPIPPYPRQPLTFRQDL
jgi:hypothetical protein